MNKKRLHRHSKVVKEKALSELDKIKSKLDDHNKLNAVRALEDEISGINMNTKIKLKSGKELTALIHRYAYEDATFNDYAYFKFFEKDVKEKINYINRRECDVSMFGFIKRLFRSRKDDVREQKNKDLERKINNVEAELRSLDEERRTLKEEAAQLDKNSEAFRILARKHKRIGDEIENQKEVLSTFLRTAERNHYSKQVDALRGALEWAEKLRLDTLDETEKNVQDLNKTRDYNKAEDLTYEDAVIDKVEENRDTTFLEKEESSISEFEEEINTLNVNKSKEDDTVLETEEKAEDVDEEDDEDEKEAKR